MNRRAVRCIACHIYLAPFGDRDIAAVVLDHLATAHRDRDTPVQLLNTNVDRRHPAFGYLPEPVA